MIGPALFAGTLRHRRFVPRSHQFDYAVFMSLLDIDELDAAMRVSRWTSLNRFNWMSFDERDHLPQHRGSLRERVLASAREHGRPRPDGPVSLLTHLRYAGYLFNPISLFYCYDHAGVLRQVMADVRNTYGGRQQYWLDRADDGAKRFRSIVPKSLFVSPFMHGDMDYEFILTPPGNELVVHMNVTPRLAQGPRHFDATLTLSARPWTARSIRSTLLQYPFMTAKVIGAIHWEALRLRWKRFPEHSV